MTNNDDLLRITTNNAVCPRCGASVPEDANFCPACGKALVISKAPKKRGNGQGCAIKRGSTWTGIRPGYKYLDEDGKQHRRRPSKGGFKTKKEALQWASNDSDVVVVPKLIELWEGYSKNDMLKLGENKQLSYKIARKRLESVINRRIDTVTVEDLQNVINAECPSYYTAKDVRDLLSNLYKRAMASNHSPVNQNLARHLVLPALEEHEAEPFTEQEVSAIWKAYNGGDIIAGFTLLMIYTGMMPIELMNLKKENIDLDSLEIRNSGAKTKVRKKAVIVFPPFLRPVVESLLDYAPGEGKLYPVNKDRFYAQYYASIERCQIRRLPPYSCRHTFGTEIVKAGVHPALVQKMLRHSNQKTQEKYTHVSAEDQHGVATQISYGLQVVDNEAASH